MEKITLYEEHRFIEKAETEVNGVWKGLIIYTDSVFITLFIFCF